jgi:hypothetical protein
VTTETQQYEQVSAHTVTIKVSMAAAAESAPASQQSVAVPFDDVKHLLSKRPLRRPNRTKPVDRP